jgi:RNA polymerase I-specific transcription initiation factor RRN3
MLRITDYCPEIADNLLSTIIDRAIQMDVSSCCSPDYFDAGDAHERA